MTDTNPVETVAADDGDWLDGALRDAHAKVKEAYKDDEPEAREPDEKPARERDENGRFAPKQAKEDAPAADAPAVESADPKPEQEAKPETPGLEPPASWSAAAKARWAALPPDIQQEVLKREGDVAKGFEAKAAESKRYGDLEQVIAPVRAKWAMRGMNESQALGGLIQTAEFLEQNPVQGIAMLAQHYGVNLGQFAQTPQAQPDPVQDALRPVLSELTTLKQQLAQREQASVEAELKAFQSANPHFDAVREDMGRMIHAGIVNTLQDAYDRAIWARPDIRQRILSDQRAADEAKRAEAAAKVSADAKKAMAVNVKGKVSASPSAGNDMWNDMENTARRLLRA